MVGDAAAELGELNAVGFVVHRGQVTAPSAKGRVIVTTIMGSPDKETSTVDHPTQSGHHRQREYYTVLTPMELWL